MRPLSRAQGQAPALLFAGVETEINGNTPHNRNHRPEQTRTQPSNMQHVVLVIVFTFTPVNCHTLRVLTYVAFPFANPNAREPPPTLFTRTAQSCGSNAPTVGKV